MAKKKKRMNIQGFRRSEQLFATIAGPEAMRLLAAAGGDIALLISRDGVVKDVAFHDSDLSAYGIDDWIDMPWEETVTTESVVKIRGLLEECASGAVTRYRQVNHPADGLRDLPVKYRLVPIDGTDEVLALGDDMRGISRIQERLVQAQLDLESDYRRFREAAERYRTVFKMIDRPMLVVGGDSGKIIDANAAATVKTGKSQSQLSGYAAVRLVDRSDAAKLEAALTKAFHSGKSTTVSVKFAGADETEEIVVDPYRENGQNNLLLRMSSDRLAPPPQGRFGMDISTLDPLPEAIVVSDTKGLIVETNSAFLDRAQVVNPDRVIGRALSDWLGASSVDMQVLMNRVRDEGKVRAFATVLRDELGGSVDVSVSAGLRAAGGNGGEDRVAFVITDAVARERGSASLGEIGGTGSEQFSELVGRVPLKDLVRDAADVIEKLCIEAALRQTNNNRASAADLLGLSRQSLYVKLRRYDLEGYEGGTR